MGEIMHSDALGALGMLTAFAGMILAMNSGTRLLGFALLAAAVVMGVAGLVRRREPVDPLLQPHKPKPGRIPLLAVIFALVGVGFNSLAPVQEKLKAIEETEYTEEQLREMEDALRYGSRNGRRLRRAERAEGASIGNPLPLGSTVRIDGWAITVHAPDAHTATYTGATTAKPYTVLVKDEVIEVAVGNATRYVAVH